MRTLLATLALLVCSSTWADGTYPPASLYHLDVTLTNQAGKQHPLDVYNGHQVLITMFYGSCQHTCPLLIETVRAVERAAPRIDNLRVLMISIDPEHDTAAALGKIAKERRIDTSRWTLASADANSVRKIAAALGIQYKRTDDGGFNHSSVISVLTAKGVIAKQSSSLGKADPEIVRALGAQAR